MSDAPAADWNLAPPPAPAPHTEAADSWARARPAPLDELVEFITAREAPGPVDLEIVPGLTMRYRRITYTEHQRARARATKGGLFDDAAYNEAVLVDHHLAVLLDGQAVVNDADRPLTVLDAELHRRFGVNNAAALLTKLYSAGTGDWLVADHANQLFVISATATITTQADEVGSDPLPVTGSSPAD